jgi:hypothetical protein
MTTLQSRIPASQELLTETEAAALLRLKVKTLQAWRQLKRGPRFTKLGSRVFYARGDLERFIQQNIVETGSGQAA